MLNHSNHDKSAGNAISNGNPADLDYLIAINDFFAVLYIYGAGDGFINFAPE